MSEQTTIESTEYDELPPGKRLSKILDESGFGSRRGRQTEFIEFLTRYAPVDWEIKAPTIHSWFTKSSPPMKKIIVIIDLLHEHYGLGTKGELKAIQAWWKVGGRSPFHTNQPVAPDNDQLRKLEFLLPSIILEEVGEEFSELGPEELNKIKTFTMDFAKSFANPGLHSCPKEYLTMAIRYINGEIKKN